MEETPTIIEEIKAMRKKAQAVRSGLEYKWEVSTKMMEGEYCQAELAREDTSKNRYAPFSNRIANAVNTKYAALTEMFERPVIVPRSADEPGLVYLTKQGKEKAKFAGVQVPSGPLNLEFMQQLSMVPNPDDDTGQSQLFNQDDFIIVDNELASDAMTDELQSQWIRAKTDYILNKSKLQKIIIGHGDMMVQWDDDKKNIEMLALDPYNVWIDPMAVNTFDADFVLVRQIVSLSKAKATWPGHDAQFEKAASESTTTEWSGNNQTGKLGDSNTTLDGKNVEHITAFLRNSGGHKLRQVEFVGDVVLEDGESAFEDIPVARDIHIPRATSNFGVGDPEYLWELQDLYRRLLGIIYEHSLFARGSSFMLPTSVLEQLKGYLRKAHTMAGQFIPVPDDQFLIHGGQPIREFRPPELSQSVFQTLQWVSSEIDRLSGQTNISRGEAYSGWSGALYEQASANARTPIGMTARHTVLSIKHLMNVAMKLILEKVPSSTLYKRNRGYEPEVWDSIKSRISGMEYDFEVQVSGASKKEADFKKLIDAAHNMPGLWNSREFVKAIARKGDLPDGQRLAEELYQANLQQKQAQQQQMAAPQQ